MGDSGVRGARQDDEQLLVFRFSVNKERMYIKGRKARAMGKMAR